MRYGYASGVVAVASLSFVLVGCTGIPTGSGRTVAAATALSGSVHGGQPPVSGSTVQFYAVGATGNGSAPTALLTPALVTDAGGGFTLPAPISCPSSSALAYATATGGNPGLAPGTNNAAFTMMSALGSCGLLGPSTFIQINEVTTVAAAVGLAPFISPPFNIGSASDSASLAALSAGFATAAAYADYRTGTSPGAGQSATATTFTAGIPVSDINTLANILSSCINSPGGTASDTSTACCMLFSLTGGATDTATAIELLEKAPAAYDATALFELASPNAPFQPQLSAAPANFGAAIIYPTGGNPSVRPIPGTIYPGGTLWAASTTSSCLQGSPNYLTVAGQFTTNGTAGCGRVNGVLPATVPYGLQLGQFITSTTSYSFYVNVVPEPELGDAADDALLDRNGRVSGLLAGYDGDKQLGCAADA